VSEPPVLQLSNVSLNYGSVRALEGVDLSLRRSEIHAIVGEHGAGKSSIANVVAGYVKPQGGEVLFDGASASRFTLKESRRRGIEVVQQNINLFDDLSIGYNLFVNNRSKIPGPLYFQKKILKDAQAFLDSMEVDLDAGTRVRDLHFPDRILVEILKGVSANPRLLILDESLEKLTSSTLGRVIAVLKQLKERGGTILFITHRIDDLYDLADRVTIIRDGKILLTDSVKNIDKINLIRLAYTQFLKQDPAPTQDPGFYQLLKYNEAILQKLPVNLLVTDKGDRICLTNEAAMRYFHIPTRLDQPRSLAQILPAGNSTAVAKISEALSAKQERVFDISLDLDGTARILNVISYPIQDGTAFIGSILILNDVTEHENLKAQVNLSERLASVGLLAAGVAHEINNPLEIIFNYLDLLKFTLKEGEARDLLGQLEEEISTIESIVSNLVTFSDSASACVEVFDIREVIESLLKLIRFTSSARGLEIIFDCAPRELLVKASKAEVRQVFLNIIKNSFEAMPNGGVLSISSGLNGTPENRACTVVFSDNGSGVLKENIKDVFLPFFSTKNETRRNRGLGLYLSYQILKKYDGTISLQNNPEGGCTVRVTLPVDRQ
jgi:ABC-type branched-subunit amino acid transport system ATPase component/nitrogen-specific signal transduction histidine kinase